MVTMCSVHVGGTPCQRPARYIGGTECPTDGERTDHDMCAEHLLFIDLPLMCSEHNVRARKLEVIDLTKADPGPGYADMLRSL